MTTNVEVQKNQNENTIGLIRRFTKRVQGAGIIQRMRGIRYHSRDLSRTMTKKRRLVLLKRQTERNELIKLGKLAERPTRERRGHSRPTTTAS